MIYTICVLILIIIFLMNKLGYFRIEKLREDFLEEERQEKERNSRNIIKRYKNKGIK